MVSESELRPYDDPYPGQVRRVRANLDAGIPVFVEHNELMTRKELILTPYEAMATFGTPSGLGRSEWWLLSWPKHGSMWVPVVGRVHWGYIAEKLQIERWPGDAHSVAAFIASLQNAPDQPIVRIEEIERRARV